MMIPHISTREKPPMKKKLVGGWMKKKSEVRTGGDHLQRRGYDQVVLAGRRLHRPRACVGRFACGGSFEGTVALRSSGFETLRRCSACHRGDPAFLWRLEEILVIPQKREKRKTHRTRPCCGCNILALAGVDVKRSSDWRLGSVESHGVLCPEFEQIETHSATGMELGHAYFEGTLEHERGLIKPSLNCCSGECMLCRCTDIVLCLPKWVLFHFDAWLVRTQRRQGPPTVAIGMHG